MGLVILFSSRIIVQKEHHIHVKDNMGLTNTVTRKRLVATASLETDIETDASRSKLETDFQYS
jgi:hypothetical protein